MPTPHRLVALAATALVLAACQDSAVPVAPDDAVPAPPSLAGARAAEPGAWIVVFRDDVRDVPGLARGLAAQHGGDVRYVYQHAIKGMALRNLPDAAVAGLRRNPNVAYVETDDPVSISATQANPTWGLDRIDQADLPLSATYGYESTGAGVRAYILDTGIRTTHADFGGRATSGFDAIDGGAATDCHGHGTHVAGTVGGTVYGVAKGVSLVAVRVLDCSGNGTDGQVIAGIDWVTANHVKPAVANMSLGGSASDALDQAVAGSITAGVTYAIAAGNGTPFFGVPLDACGQSPARVPAALTVGATTSSDAESSFSNYGTCVDILAPGSGVLSLGHTSDVATTTKSGTSMAAPHVAGVVARWLQANPGATPAVVASHIVGTATPGTINLHSSSRNGGTPNRFLFAAAGTTQPPQNQAPTANFTPSCNGLSCSFTNTSTDTDGTVASSKWTFHDGTTATTTNASKNYSGSGTYAVTLEVTDNGGLKGSVTKQVTVTAPSTGGIVLTATGAKNKGNKVVTLNWTGSTTNVDVYRGTTRVGSSLSGTTFTDNLGKGGGSYTYQVCPVGVARGAAGCSNTATVTF